MTPPMLQSFLKLGKFLMQFMKLRDAVLHLHRIISSPFYSDCYMLVIIAFSAKSIESGALGEHNAPAIFGVTKLT